MVTTCCNGDGIVRFDIFLIFWKYLLSTDMIWLPFKDYLKKEIILISKNCIDDNIFGHEIKIIARTYIKKKIGLKPSTNVEIIRI